MKLLMRSEYFVDDHRSEDSIHSVKFLVEEMVALSYI